MITTRRAALLIIAGLILSTPVYAGTPSNNNNGGKKRNGTIHVTNNSTSTIGVTTNANSTAIQTAFNNNDVSAFLAAGGKILSAGQSATFNSLSGTYTIGAAAETNATGTATTFGPPITENVNVGKGQNVNISIINGGTAGTIAFAP